MGPPGPPGPKGETGQAGKTGLTGAKGTQRKCIILKQELFQRIGLFQNVSFCKLNVERPNEAVECSNHYQHSESTLFSEVKKKLPFCFYN